MIKALRSAAILAMAATLAGCAGTSNPSPRMSATPAQDVADARCRGAGIAIDTAFAAGALDTCSVAADGTVTIVIAPEDAPPINCSPWYAFRVHSDEARTVPVTLTYSACGHRYRPKVSHDGIAWDYLPDDAVEVEETADTTTARLMVQTDGRPLYVAAQEIVAPATYDAWLDGLQKHPSARRYTLGGSAEGRPIDAIEIGNEAAREQVVLVGRQHPPEVTGALAMFPFVETIAGDSDLAQRFRARFNVVAVPLLNPDGVVRGHWRHSTGGVDLNRDWGPFTQPETRLMRDLLARIADDPAREPVLMLDFHSTGHDVFYTIPDELETDPPLFTKLWLERYQQLMPGYEVNRDARHVADRPISKAYVYDQYGIPGVTFEIGDETDRDLIRRIGQQAAAAMMETLLATPEE